MTFHRDMFRIMRSASISALTLALWFALTLVPKKALAEDISNCLCNDQHFHMQAGCTERIRS